MRDLGEYLRAYSAYVSANLGWGKALRFAPVNQIENSPAAFRRLLNLDRRLIPKLLVVTSGPYSCCDYVRVGSKCGKARAQCKGSASPR
jgi:hypothetical protein